MTVPAAAPGAEAEPGADAQPMITSALLTVGHDGEAEAMIELLFPNGARQGLTFTCDMLAGALDRAGITALEQLVGHPWNVLLGAD